MSMGSEVVNTPLNGRIRITDPAHLFRCGEMFGLKSAIEQVKALNITTAGIGAALAVMEKVDAENRVSTMSKNLRLAHSEGAALDRVNVQLRWEPDGLFLEWSDSDDAALAANGGTQP